jgi:peptide/nickel transport system permease protein
MSDDIKQDAQGSSEVSVKTTGGESLWKDAWRRLKRNVPAMLSLGMILVFLCTALYGEVVYWSYNIIDADAPAWLAPVQKVFVKVLAAERVKGVEAPYDRQDLNSMYEPPSRGHIMGTDGLGRDVFYRLIQGARIAFQVGVVTSLIAIAIGVILGCLAGYFGGWVDDFVVWLYSTFASMPDLLFILAIAMVAGKGLFGIYMGIGLTTWVHLCRLMRGEVMKHKERSYVQAARALGLGDMRIIFGHILPNVMHLIVITFSLRFPAAIGTEVFMSFLGIGVQNDPSWGIMISTARLRLWYGMWWEMTFTTLAILLVVLAFNLFGDALRDALDPRLRTRTDV